MRYTREDPADWARTPRTTPDVDWFLVAIYMGLTGACLGFWVRVVDWLLGVL